jgi:hypothetical protein
VDCVKCHALIQDAKPYVKYTGLSFAKCTGCHVDPHKGAFKGSCESCHVTSSWTRIAQMEGFDHDKTKFPLLGKHKTVDCSDCHTKGDFKTPVPHAKCMDCHQDAHHGQFNAQNHGECAPCHNEANWKPSTFGVKEHAATKYPLEGLHVPVACDKCHVPKGAKGRDTEFTTTATQCKDCHEDIHKGQFAAAPSLNRCEICHNLKNKAFRPAIFALAKHKDTRFPLTGAHIAVPCADCHKAVPKGSVTPVKYRFDDRACTVCHDDPHHGEFRAVMEAKLPGGSRAGCEACHSTVKWSEMTHFDHSKTKFPLTGAHRGVACIDCHRPPALETTLKNVDYTAAPKTCTGCHEDVHANQFASRPEATDCSSCHDAVRWKPSQFDHDKRTKYPLDGAHKDVPCLECHKLTREVAGKLVVIYNPTPMACKDCHGGK